jgi:hypothetical protein
MSAVNAAWLSCPIIMCESYLASGDKPVKQNANAESQHTKQMKITKQHLVDRLGDLYNVTGIHFDLSYQSIGNGKGYSVMSAGSHVMTYGHVPAAVLDACITAFARGFHRGEEGFKPEGF